jgi:hypothetical protein
VAWRRHIEPPRIEPPLWYRTYDPAQWDEPDSQELAMTGGCPRDDVPVDLHEAHAQRRWHEAKHRYRQEHPALASQEFDDLVNGERAARRAERERYGGPASAP